MRDGWRLTSGSFFSTTSGISFVAETGLDVDKASCLPAFSVCMWVPVSVGLTGELSVLLSVFVFVGVCVSV